MKNKRQLTDDNTKMNQILALHNFIVIVCVRVFVCVYVCDENNWDLLS